MSPLSLIEDLRCPGCRSELDRSGTPGLIHCLVCSQDVGESFPGERRIAWHLRGTREEALKERVRLERSKYDSWAELRTPRLNDQRSSDLDAWLASSRALRRAVRRWPVLGDLKNLRVLDIGGSCKDSWRFLYNGVAHLDQVEISAASQRLALGRLELAMEGVEQWRERVTFHTTAAELLPFRSDRFDLVFSRSTIHHTERPRTYEEIRRVLKPGGVFFAIEPYLTPFTQQLMRLSRRLRRADRGTDQPLLRSDLRALDRVFRRADSYVFNSASFLWTISGGRLIGSGIPRRVLRKIDDLVGNPLGLGFLVGGMRWVAAEK